MSLKLRCFVDLNVVLAEHVFKILQFMGLNPK
jgi:hypothetical protein